MKLAAALALCATQAVADTDFKALSEGERLIFRAEIRAVLLAQPEIVDAALNPQFSPYIDAVTSDLEVINTHSDALFGPHDLALIVGADCAECPRAQAELTDLATSHGLTVNIIKLGAVPELAQALQIDSLPFYVLPKMMLRGTMPNVVLKRYLTELAG